MCLAVPGKLMSVSADDPLQRTGKVSFGGVLKEVNLACLPEAKVGDYVIVHAGLAISLLDEAEANEVFDYLRKIDLAAGGERPTA
jgi:hydrogenase expression/formation protein HypC